MPTGIALAIAIGLLLVNAVFVAGEFCVTSTRRAQIDPLVEQGNARAKSAQWALENVSLVLAMTQLGITLASTGLGVVAEPAVAKLIESPLEHFGAPPALIHSIGFILALIIVVFLHILIGEMIPKNLTVSANVKVCLALAPTLVRLSRATKHVIHALNRFANFMIRLFGAEPKDELDSAFTVEEVASIVTHSEEAGMIHDDLGLLAGSLEFSKKDVRTVMVPLAQIVALTQPFTPLEVEKLVSQTGFSRFLVQDPAGQFIGYVHLKDMLYAQTQSLRNTVIEDWRIRPLPVVAPDEEVEEALQTMRKSGVHLAEVKEGKTGMLLGFIFLEDILEELVGEVRDSMQRERKTA